MQVSEGTGAHEGNNEGLQSRLMIAKQVSECKITTFPTIRQ